MVTFGKTLKETQIQEWKGYYISYKLLKKKVNRYTQQIAGGEENQQEVLGDFSRTLDHQIEKIVIFLLEQQGLLAKRLSKLAEQRNVLHDSAAESDLAELRDGYREVGEDLLRLIVFVEMNATGLRKILKKFDKRCCYKFTNYYVKTRADHPYSQLRQVFKIVGFSAVAGTICRNLADLEDFSGSYVSIYDRPEVFCQDPIFGCIRAAVKRLSDSTSFLEFMGNRAFIAQDDASVDKDNHLKEQRFHLMSLLLNLMNTFLYMVNTYIIVPTADKYSLELGAPATVCGAIIGSMALAQIFSSVYFSAWSNRSYLRPLLFSSFVLLVGNTFYALAYDLNSIKVLLVGRLFCGLGSARAVNRRYISDCVPQKWRMKASAGFVSASALGMACGPAFACLFQTRFKIGNVTFCEDTLPGWAMAFAWLIYLILVWICFKEPSLLKTGELLLPRTSSGSSTINSDEYCVTQRLLLESEEQQDLDMNQEDDEQEDDSECNDMPATSIMSAYRLLSPSVKVQLLIYFMLKFSMEILLAGSSVITGYYFVWTTQSVATFLACLGITVLPVNVVVGSYISNKFEERQILITSEILMCIGIALSFNVLNSYSVPQYVGSALLTFVSAEVVEGVNLSLLSKVMSPRLSSGTYNGGLLSTEAGTIARVIADGTITLAGYLEATMLLNISLVPSLFICIFSILATCLTYNSLY